MRLIRFDILRVYSVVADFRIGHVHNLALVGRVRENLLIAGHRSVEAYLTRGRCGRTKTFAVINCAVFESENCHGSALKPTDAR